MPKRIAITQLQGATLDILNVIRANASPEYQNMVPVAETIHDIPKVGEILFGYPALSNQFLATLMNRIALVRVKSATFNNKFSMFKKGYLEFGETVEEIFVELAKVQRFDPEKAPAREFKRTIPNVKNAFHVMNFPLQYPITISNQQLRTAFTSEEGVRNLVEMIIQSVYTAAEYDEWLVIKYLVIKAVASGKMAPIGIGDGTMKDAAVKFRGTSNQMEFIRTDFNPSGVHTTTPKSRQYILMDAMYNAEYDVNVLASAFNMDKTTFAGKLVLVDSFTTFDNERWAELRKECDNVEEVTADELALMQDVKAILLDSDWFQIYDNLIEMGETYVASGMYHNYWLTNLKTVSYSPFANAVVFVTEGSVSVPNTIDMVVQSRMTEGDHTFITVVPKSVSGFNPTDGVHVQTERATTLGAAVHPYGAYIIPNSISTAAFPVTVKVGNIEYTNQSGMSITASQGSTITLTKV